MEANKYYVDGEVKKLDSENICEICFRIFRLSSNI